MSGERIGPLFAALLSAQGSATPCDIATPATPATQHRESRNVAAVASVPGFSRELADRICRMARRWQYTPNDLAEALAAARSDPSAWLMCVQADEEHHARCARAEIKPVSGWSQS